MHIQNNVSVLINEHVKPGINKSIHISYRMARFLFDFEIERVTNLVENSSEPDDGNIFRFLKKNLMCFRIYNPAAGQSKA